MDYLDLSTNLSDILSKYPQTAKTFRKFGIQTSGWGARSLLTMSIEQAAQRYRINTATLIKTLEMAIQQSIQQAKHQWSN